MHRYKKVVVSSVKSSRIHRGLTVFFPFFLMWSVALVSVMGCGKSAPPPTAPNAAAPTPSPAEAAKTATAKAAAERSAAARVAAQKKKAMPVKQEIRLLADIAEADVLKLLEIWVKAQNSGDYETYAALYAQRFYGTKRSGNRSRTFQRRAWLRDRKRMFGKQMSVEAKEPEVLTTAGTARLLFEQTWASGRYKDVGPKQLVIVRERGELRIAREEMLTSVVDADGPKAAPLDAENFGFVLHDGGHYLVLHTHPEAEWANGKRLRLLQAGGYASITSPVNPAKLPKKFQAWRGRKVVFYGPNGVVCRGQAVALSVMSRVRPHFSTVAYWRGDLDAKPDGATVAREAWRLGDTGRLLVARVLPMQGNDCRGATWGRAADASAPKIAAIAAIEPMIAARAIGQLKKLKGFALIQKAFVEEMELPRAVSWDKMKDATLKVSMLASSDGTRRFVSAALSAGSGCAEFRGEFWAIWRVVGAGESARLQLLTDDIAPGRLFIPRAAADMDGDGKYEFLGVDGLLQPAGPILRETESVEVPSLDCPC